MRVLKITFNCFHDNLLSRQNERSFSKNYPVISAQKRKKYALFQWGNFCFANFVFLS